MPSPNPDSPGYKPRRFLPFSHHPHPIHQQTCQLCHQRSQSHPLVSMSALTPQPKPSEGCWNTELPGGGAALTLGLSVSKLVFLGREAPFPIVSLSVIRVTFLSYFSIGSELRAWRRHFSAPSKTATLTPYRSNNIPIYNFPDSSF